MLTNAQAAILNNAIAKHLETTGMKNGMSMPKSTSNTALFAWKFYVATKIAAFGEAMKKEAIGQCIGNGVMFDHKSHPRPAGTKEIIYSSDIITMSVDVKNGSKKTNAVGFFEDLLIAGVDKTLLLKLWDKNTTTTAAPHTFTASLNTGG